MGLFGLFFGLRGRANRMQYWIGAILANIAASFTMQMSGMLMVLAPPSEGTLLPAMGVGAFVLLGVALTNLWVSIALTVKRLHDRGRTGWIALVSLIPAVAMGWVVGAALRSPQGILGVVEMIMPVLMITLAVGLYFFIDLGLLPGVEGPNNYGDQPSGGFMPRRKIGPINFDAARGPSTLGGAEAALDRAIAERRAAKPNPYDASPRPATAAAPMRPIVSQTPSFGRRGLT